MSLRFEARESVGYRATCTIGGRDSPIDITGWTFEATFERQAGAPDFSLAMAESLDPAAEGLFIVAGAGGMLGINILPETLQDIDDTTGDFTLAADLLATPPGGARQFIGALRGQITKGPTE